jgi:hypothetical protein
MMRAAEDQRAEDQRAENFEGYGSSRKEARAKIISLGLTLCISGNTLRRQLYAVVVTLVAQTAVFWPRIISIAQRWKSTLIAGSLARLREQTPPQFFYAIHQ